MKRLIYATLVLIASIGAYKVSAQQEAAPSPVNMQVNNGQIINVTPVKTGVQTN